MEKILITGSAGLLGGFLKGRLKNANCFGLDNIGSVTTDLVGDIRDFKKLANILDRIKPTVIINAAAIKDLVVCERNQLLAWETNVNPVVFLSDYCSRKNIFLIQMSSDLVFNGNKGNYKEDDTPVPINWYGATKAAAESCMFNGGSSGAICRTSQILGPLLPKDSKFLQVAIRNGDLTNQSLLPYYIHRRLLLNKTVSASKNFTSTPTPLPLLLEGLEKVIKKRARGIFHLSGDRQLSRYDVALFIAQKYKLNKRLIKSTLDATSPWRPRLATLSSVKTKKFLDIKKWSVDVLDYLIQQIDASQRI